MKDRAKETVTAAAGEIRHLGDYIRDQRNAGGISLRQLAKLAGVSNPYLSQIERGLRKPSADILQQIAKGLRISAEALYVQAGFLEARVGTGPVVDAILADEALTERQKQVLLEIYQSFRKEDDTTPDGGDVVVSVVTASGEVEPEPTAPPRRRKAGPKTPTSTTAGTTTGTTTPAPGSTVPVDPTA